MIKPQRTQKVAKIGAAGRQRSFFKNLSASIVILDRFDEHIGANSFPGEFQLREDSRNRGRLLLGDEAVGKLVQVIGLPGKVGCENLTAARNCFAEGVGSAA